MKGWSVYVSARFRFSMVARPVLEHVHSSLSVLGSDEEAVAIQEFLERIKQWGPRDDAVDP
jgi:hypothetical protein